MESGQADGSISQLRAGPGTASVLTGRCASSRTDRQALQQQGRPDHNQAAPIHLTLETPAATPPPRTFVVFDEQADLGGVCCVDGVRDGDPQRLVLAWRLRDLLQGDDLQAPDGHV